MPITPAVPPVGTSAYKAYQRQANLQNPKTYSSDNGFSGVSGSFNKPNPFSSVSGKLFGSLPDFNVESPSKPLTYSRRRSSGGSARAALDYYEAPLAEYYGFGKETAYQEAMANTAYRREIADMRKAGLNPSVIYGDHNTTGAASDVFPRGGSGGSGGSGRRFGSGKSGKYVFSGGAYYGIMAAVGTATTLATKNVGAGMAASAMAGTAMKALNGFLKGR